MTFAIWERRVAQNRVARLARLAGIRAQIGYKRRPGKYGGQTFSRRGQYAEPPI